MGEKSRRGAQNQLGNNRHCPTLPAGPERMSVMSYRETPDSTALQTKELPQPVERNGANL